eukprot:GEMP01009606.1.p1 GENE.GEMP01009606.1~~GEMP01009606.1.p1  ORF type:complete len:653 (-),score=130.91 GEMP01009606.1:1271-3229(-)
MTLATPRDAITPRTRYVTPRNQVAAQHAAKLPCLPGYARQMYRTHNPKPQTLVFRMDCPMATTKLDIPKLGAEQLEGLFTNAIAARYKKGPVVTHDERREMKDSARNKFVPHKAPAWLKHDGQVLRFYGYFQESVHESPTENVRVRSCQLLYYLEDGTVHVVEPKVQNSGITQGVLIKRHRIPHPSGGFFEPHHFKRGTTVCIYCRAFRLTECDAFTTWFYDQAELDLGEPEEEPQDLFVENEKKNKITDLCATGIPRDVAEGKEFTDLMLGGNRKNIKLQQYLANDRKVLKFDSYWDDDSLYGARNFYAIHYFLADDTLEIIERQSRNSGRDPFPVFFQRSRLRKNPVISATPGMLEPDPVYYSPENLSVGETINVHGRNFFLHNCDGFTRDFYQKHYNIKQGTVELPKNETITVRLPPPPHTTGIGSEEDTLANCKHLTPRPPRVDLARLLSQSDHNLRFNAVMDNGYSGDDAREFIITVYVADETLSVFERRQRNSGHTEGKFSERKRIKNPNTKQFYVAEDFYVGAEIAIYGIRFRVVSADEHTLRYMEDHCDQFEMSDVGLVCHKIQNLAQDEEFCGLYSVHPEDLRSLVMRKLHGYLTDQELITLLRDLGESSSSLIPVAALLEVFELGPLNYERPKLSPRFSLCE